MGRLTFILNGKPTLVARYARFYRGFASMM
jgi:hypothetical protein